MTVRRARAKFRIHRPAEGSAGESTEGSGAVSPRAAASTSFTPPQLAKLYDFPTGLDGSGQCIAIVELGGGFRNDDLKAYFAKLGIPLPQVMAVAVDGAHNSPDGNPNSADGEVMLDIEVAAAIAPRAKIAVYFAPNTDRGFLDAITTAIHDTARTPSVISISWGGPEASWTPQAMQTYDQAFQDAATLGVTVCCASGDNGSADMARTGTARPTWTSRRRARTCWDAAGLTWMQPATPSPSEVVWNDLPHGGAGGGGVSDEFPLPAWQAQAHVPPSANPGGRVGRGVPDVCGDASPRSGYVVRVDGQQMVIGGTSAVAPALGRADRAHESASRSSGGLSQPADLRPVPGGQGISRHHGGEQRRLQRRRRAGTHARDWAARSATRLMAALQ